MKVKPELEAKYQEYKTLNSKDPYSARIVSYGEDWANLMEAELEAGKSLEDIADPTRTTADTDGITGFMHGAAVNALAHFWQHGEALRIWHNAKYNVSPNTKGVVNPAILTVKV